MKHSGTQRLETDRLVLRRYTRADAAAMYKNWSPNVGLLSVLSKQILG